MAVWVSQGSRVGSVLVSCLTVNQLLNASNHSAARVVIPTHSYFRELKG